MPGYAVIKLWGASGFIARWDRVEENTVSRHGDGSLSFRYKIEPSAPDNKLKSRRVTLYGSYTVEYSEGYEP